MMFGHQDDDHGQSQSDNPVNDSQFVASPGPATQTDDNVAAEPTINPVDDHQTPADEPLLTSGEDSSVSSDDSQTPPELLDLKRQTLQELAPLVGNLEQTPEEKFRTMMMLIQASDNQSLLKDAHEAALQIADEKERAQALLDVVNEINYFTQHPAA